MQPKITDESLEHALTQMRTASNQFIQGDPTLWKQLCSHRDDATIMGGWGKVGPRCDWATSRFAAGEMEIEYLAHGADWRPLAQFIGNYTRFAHGGAHENVDVHNTQSSAQRC